VSKRKLQATYPLGRKLTPCPSGSEEKPTRSHRLQQTLSRIPLLWNSFHPPEIRMDGATDSDAAANAPESQASITHAPESSKNGLLEDDVDANPAEPQLSVRPAINVIINTVKFTSLYQ
jgi:hypothetical protein